MHQDPHKEKLSERMRFANAARLSKGRTGPKGEEGIKEELYKQLGRDADPDEVQYEMNRKKGYSRVAQKQKAARARQQANASDNEDVHGESLERGGSRGVDAEGHLNLSQSEAERGSEIYDMNYVLQMEKELRDLKRKMCEAQQSAMQETMLDARLSMSMHVGGRESNASFPTGIENIVSLEEVT